MAATLLSNVIVPQVFAPYMLEQSLVKNALIQSGVISRKWIGTAAGIVPTDSELATAAKWNLVFAPKAVGVTALIHNAA